MNGEEKGDVDRELAVVEEELRKREKKLAVLVDEIRRATMELSSYSVRGSLRQGDIGKMKNVEAHQSSLRKILKLKEAERLELEMDVKRARERKAMLLEEQRSAR